MILRETKYLFLIGSIAFLSACSGIKGSGTHQAVEAENQAETDPLAERERMQFDRAFFAGQKEKALGNYDRALEYFLEALRIDGGNGAVMYELSLMYLEFQNLPQAQFFCEGAVEVDPGNRWYRMVLADIYGLQRNYPAQGQQYEELQNIEPNNPEHSFNLAITLLQQNDLKGALKVYDQMEKRYGVIEEIALQKELIHVKLGDIDKAATELEKLIETDPDNVQYYVLLAELYIANDMLPEGKAQYDRALELFPQAPEVHLGLAGYYEANGQFDLALKSYIIAFQNPDLNIDAKMQVILNYYERSGRNPDLREDAMLLVQSVIDAHPNNPKGYAVQGDFYLREEKPEMARASFRKSIEAGATQYPIWQQVLLLDADMNDLDALLEESTAALELFPAQPLVYLLNGFSLMADEQYEAAAEVLEAGRDFALGNKPLQAQFDSYLGDAYHQIGNDKKSDSYYEKALAYDENNAAVLNNFAYYLSVRGEKLEKAEQYSKRSNELSPNNGTYQDTYAWVLYKLARYDEALNWIQKAINNGGGESGEVREHYGDILFKLGQTEAALKEWERAQDLGGASEFIEQKIRDQKLYE